MKKLFTLIAMCLLGVGAMQADEATIDLSAITPAKTGTDVTASVTDGVATMNLKTVSGNAVSYATANFYTKISQIDITINTSNRSAASFKVEIASDKNFSNIIETISSSYSDGTLTFGTGSISSTNKSASVACKLTPSDIISGYVRITSALGKASGDDVTSKISAVKVTYTNATGCVLSTTTYAAVGTNSETDLSSTSYTGTWTNNNAYTFTLTGATTGELVRNGSSSYRMTNLTYTDTKGDIPVLLNKTTKGDGVYNITKSSNIKSVTLYAKKTVDTAGGTVYGDYGLSTQKELISSLPTRTTSDTNPPASVDITNYSNIRVEQGTYVEFVIEYYSAAELTVANINWASLYLPFDATIPTGMKVYYATQSTSPTSEQDGTLTLKEITSAIPANTGVVVNAETGVYTLNAAASATKVNDNLFSGVTADKTFTEDEGYVLAGASTDKTSPIFQMYASGSTLAAYKAYLPKDNVPSAAKGGVINFVFDGGTTAINAVSSSKVQVPGTRKAMVNGKFVIVKNGKQYNAAGAQIK